MTYCTIIYYSILYYPILYSNMYPIWKPVTRGGRPPASVGPPPRARVDGPPRRRRIGNLGLSWKLDPNSELCFPNSKLDLDEFET